MKHVFLINPAAGKGKICGELEGNIREYCAGNDIDYEIYYTQGVGDAEDYIKRVCGEAVNDECRFYAAGGDGTFCEAVNGAAGVPFASVGIIPIGTGNDFFRNFTRPELFFDIAAQISGDIVPLDLIKYNDRYSANMLNTGFDCEVVRKTSQIKRNPAVPNKLAYVLSAFIELIRKPGVKMKVSVDGEMAVDKDLFLACIGNGGFCGGGFHSEPYADVSDGLLDVCFVKNLTRVKFVSLLGSYKNGTYLAKNGIEKIAEYVKCKTLEIAFPHPQSVSVDGEIEDYEKLSVSAAPGALRFCLPAGSAVAIPPLYKKTVATV